MKKKIAVLALIAAAMGTGVKAWAFTSTQITTVTAGTFVGGQRVARFRLDIRDTANPFNGVIRSSITWVGVNSGQGWTIADRLLIINSTVTDSNGGVQIYTDNTAADASPRFVDPTPGTPTNPDSVAAGLLEGTSGTTADVLPMAWSIKSSTKVVGGAGLLTGIQPSDPNNGAATGSGNRFQWLFVTDKANTSGIDFDSDGVIVDGGGVLDPGDAAPFVNGGNFQTAIFQDGLHTGQGPGDIEGSAGTGLNAFVYFQANFAQAAAQQAYQTTTLRVEAFVQ